MKGRISVIGSVIIDRIFYSNGEQFEGFGGITYNLTALAKFLPDYEIFPIAFVGKNDSERFRDFLSPYKNIRFSGLMSSLLGSNTNSIYYKNDEPEEELIELVTPPFSFAELAPYLENPVAVLVNFTKNDDLILEDMLALSKFYRGILSLDIHSLVRKRDPSGHWIYNQIDNYAKWCVTADIIQLNYKEASFFSGISSQNLEDYQKAAKLFLSYGAKAVNLTLGKDGAILAWREGGNFHCDLIPAKPTKVVDPTGCGDVFASAFLAQYLITGDPLKSARFANLKAGEKALRKGANWC